MSGKTKILCLEDNEDDALIIREILEEGGMDL
jgi:CheY-like chemotaxis protein